MKQQTSSTKRHVLKPAEMAGLLAELSPCGGRDVPRHVIGWLRKRVWTRVRADYPNGWELVVNFDKHGSVSSHTAKFSLTARIHPANSPIETAAV